MACKAILAIADTARAQSEPVPMAQVLITPRYFLEIGCSILATSQQVSDLFRLPKIDPVCTERIKAALDMVNK